ncbi:uncharacterized [Tachysurus ichikawai]
MTLGILVTKQREYEHHRPGKVPVANQRAVPECSATKPGTFEPPAQTSGTSPRLRHNRLARAAREDGKKRTAVIITAALQDTFMWGEENSNEQL